MASMTTRISASFLAPILLWLAAFVCSLFPFNDFSLELFAVCVTLTYLWAFVMLARNVQTGWSVPKAAVLTLAGAFWLLTLISLFWSEIKPVTLLATCMFSVMPVTFLVAGTQWDERSFRTVALSMAVIFFALGVWAVVQFLFLADYFGPQAHHPLGDPSSLGALFSLALFCALGWMTYDTNKLRRVLALGLALSLAAGIIATVARGPVFALIPGLIIFLFFGRARVKQARGILLSFILGVALIFGLMSLHRTPGYETMSQRIAKTVMLEGDVSNYRTILWDSTLHLIEQHPWLGTGFGTYFFFIPEYKDPTYTAAVYHAHNDPLEFFAELGILGPILFYVFVIVAALRMAGTMKKLQPAQDKERMILITTFSALVSMVVQSYVNFSLYNISILMLGGLVLAVWFHYSHVVKGDEESALAMPDNYSPWTGKIVLALPFVMLLALFLCNIAGEIFTNRARNELFQGNMQGFANDVNHAMEVAPGMNYRAYILAVNVPLTLLEINKSTMDADHRKELYEQAKRYMNIVLSINPRVQSAYYYLAKAQELAGPDAIPPGEMTPEDLYKKALQLDPMDLASRTGLYDLYVKEKRPRADLYAVMEPAANMFFNTPLAMQYYQTLAKMYMEDGNYVKMKEVMGKMVQFQKRSEESKKYLSMTPMQVIMSHDPMQ